MTSDHESLLEDLLAGEHRALARVISKIENRSPGYRDLVSELYAHMGEAGVIGITGSPGGGSRRWSTNSPRHTATAARRPGSSRSTPSRPSRAVQCWATASEWVRPSATWRSSSAR